MSLEAAGLDPTQNRNSTPSSELPKPSELLDFAHNKSIPDPAQFDSAQAWLGHTRAEGYFDPEGNLLDEDGNQLVAKEDYEEIETHFDTQSWLMSKDEILLLEGIAARPKPSIRTHADKLATVNKADRELMFMERPKPGDPLHPGGVDSINSLPGAKVNTFGQSADFGYVVELALEDKTTEERALALKTLAESASALIVLDQHIRAGLLEKSVNRGTELREKREQLIAGKLFKETYDTALDQLTQEAMATHPNFDKLDPSEQAEIQSEITQKAQELANSAKDEYLENRKKIFEEDPNQRSLRAQKRDAQGSRRDTEAGLLTLNGSKEGRVRVETKTDKALKQWDEANQSELEAISEELSKTIAHALGEVTVLDAKGKPVESLTKKFIRTNEDPTKFASGETFLARPMKLTRKQALARRNADYHSGKKRLSRKEIQRELDEKVNGTRADFSDAWRRKRELTTRQMELNVERETIKYGLATDTLYAQLEKVI